MVYNGVMVWIWVFILGLLTAGVSPILVKHYKTKKRREYLMAKYRSNHALVSKLMENKVWLGMTEDQLLDSLGKPIDIDLRVRKTRSKETWKYSRLRVKLEKGKVVEWDKR